MTDLGLWTPDDDNWRVTRELSCPCGHIWRDHEAVNGRAECDVCDCTTTDYPPALNEEPA